jgi:acetyl-CoA C-acetyltransferase
MFKDIVLVAPTRTPIGSYGGVFKQVPATELGAAVIRETVKRAGLDPEKVDAVFMGNVVQAGNKMNPARQAAMQGGLSHHTPAMTVNRVCGSGLQAVFNAVQEIALGTSEFAVAGGMENMDMAPYLVPGGRWGYRMGDAPMHDSMLRDGLHDAFSDHHSGWHTEDLITKYNITREAQDLWAYNSQARFARAQASGLFRQEIIGIEVKEKKGTVLISDDTSNRPDTTLEALQKLKAAFRPEGSLTAGNSPGLNTGAAAMVVTTLKNVEFHGLSPSVRVLAYAVSAVEPGFFGIAPAPAIRLVLQRAGWRLEDVDRFEINEAYAAVPLAVIKELGLDAARVNVEGGAVAHGHPIGATGAILTTRLIHAMARDGLQKGIVSLCIGGGQGVAMAIERC